MKPWVKFGLGWGLYMFVAMAFIWPLLDNSLEITFNNVIFKFVFNLISGLIFGYLQHKYKKYKHVIQPNKK